MHRTIDPRAARRVRKRTAAQPAANPSGPSVGLSFGVLGGGLVALAGVAAPVTGLQAQEGEPPPRVMLVALAGPAWSATRFEWTAPAGGRYRVGPASALTLGGAVELRAWDHVALTASGSWSTPAYEGSGDGDATPEFLSSGDQQIVRLTGGVHYRVRPSARGYFAAGAAVNLVTPDTGAFFSDEEARTEWGGYGGVGLDFGSGRTRFRAEGRGQLSRVRSPDATAFGEVFTARDWAFDVLVLVGVAWGF